MEATVADLIDRLRAKAGLSIAPHAPHLMPGRVYVYDADMRDLLTEAADALAARAQGGDAVLALADELMRCANQSQDEPEVGMAYADAAGRVRTLHAALSTPQPDAVELRRLLALIYAAHEDGDPCYADDVYLGRAFKLSDEDEAAIVAALSAQGAAGAGEDR